MQIKSIEELDVYQQRMVRTKELMAMPEVPLLLTDSKDLTNAVVQFKITDVVKANATLSFIMYSSDQLDLVPGLEWESVGNNISHGKPISERVLQSYIKEQMENLDPYDPQGESKLNVYRDMLKYIDKY